MLSRRSASIPRAASASTSVRRRAASRTRSSSAARCGSTRSTSGGASSPSRCDGIRASARGSGRTPATSTLALLGESVSVAVIDVSFISLRLVLPPVAACLAPGGDVVALVKPQFEAGRGRAPGGVVRDGGRPPGGPRDRPGPRPGGGPRARRARGLAAHRTGRQPRVLRPRRRAMRRRAEPDTLGAADRRPGAVMTGLRRIGFAYNPTKDDAVALAARATAWCEQRWLAILVDPGGRHGGPRGGVGTRGRRRRPRGRRDVPSGRPGGRAGERPDRRGEPREDRIPLQGGGTRDREPARAGRGGPLSPGRPDGPPRRDLG